jgi:chromatin segregation and condensation protein Rec8/ScpA/Scc1 (kleisin family)
MNTCTVSLAQRLMSTTPELKTQGFSCHHFYKIKIIHFVQKSQKIIHCGSIFISMFTLMKKNKLKTRQLSLS